MKQSVPETFDSLYQLSSLEKQYNKFYGNREGHKKFLDLFKNNFITPLSQRDDINNILKLHKDNRINITPHIAGATLGSQKKAAELAFSIIESNV